MSRFINKVSIVTGAASGIGLATAERLVAEGGNVLLTDLNEEAGSEAAQRLGAAAGFRVHDAASEADWESVVADCVSRFGRLDVLVNNAGVAFLAGQLSPEEVTLEEWQRVNAVNAAGVMLGCKHAIRAMKSSGGGAIVNIASIAATVASPLAVPYGASKAAVVQLTKTVAYDCARRGYNIRCNAVLPGTIETTLYKTFSEEQRAANARGVPLGRVGTPEDVAVAVAFLASDEADYITGAQVAVDGGLSVVNPM
ncbi:MAG: glucose 1-dehydrogenase, partial [Rhodospirillaceae bacterium]|nr:glucose 1-dehydrogenase [Rhodospirillaceae bacterium]